MSIDILIMSYFFAYFSLFVVVRSAPIYRELSENLECEQNRDGVFTDPTEILGVRFTRSRMRDLCETSVLISPGAIAKRVVHTWHGCRVCGDVCDRYRETVGQNGCVPTKVTSLHGYCQLNGGDQPVELREFGSSCLCTYKVVRSGKSVEFAQYSFDVNEAGQVRVSVFEPGRRRFVTVNPSAACP